MLHALMGRGVALLGPAIEYAGIRPLYAAGHDYQLLFTFGLSLILGEGIIVVWGPIGFSQLPPSILRGGLDLGFIFYPKYRLFVMVMAGLLVLSPWPPPPAPAWPGSPGRSPRLSAASRPRWAWTCSASPSSWSRSVGSATCSVPSPRGSSSGWRRPPSPPAGPRPRGG